MDEGDHYCGKIYRETANDRIFPIIRLSKWQDKSVKYFPDSTIGLIKIIFYFIF